MSKAQTQIKTALLALDTFGNMFSSDLKTCEYGHYECSMTERGACSDELLGLLNLALNAIGEGAE